MSDSVWVPTVADTAVIPERVTQVFPKGIGVLLIKKGRTIYAVSNRCAHMACSLGRSTVDGYTLTCPCHDWRFDIRTGAFLDAPEIRIPVYESRLVNGLIEVKL